jgi:hypothetical protein
MILYEVYDSQSFLTTLPILFTDRSYIENIIQQPTVFWAILCPSLFFLSFFGIGVSRALGTAKRQLYEMTDCLREEVLVDGPSFVSFTLYSFSFF